MNTDKAITGRNSYTSFLKHGKECWCIYSEHGRMVPVCFANTQLGTHSEIYNWMINVLTHSAYNEIQVWLLRYLPKWMVFWTSEYQILPPGFQGINIQKTMTIFNKHKQILSYCIMIRCQRSRLISISFFYKVYTSISLKDSTKRH
jgi:hypothetical protein